MAIVELGRELSTPDRLTEHAQRVTIEVDGEPIKQGRVG
jgi:hypothetical protein